MDQASSGILIARCEEGRFAAMASASKELVVVPFDGKPGRLGRALNDFGLA